MLMPSKDAIIKDVITIAPDQKISEALNLFETHGIRKVPVIDSDYKLIGLFSFSNLLNALLPITAESDIRGFEHLDINLDFLGETAPWVASRLNLIIDRSVSDFMTKDLETVSPDTPLRESIRLIVKFGSPLCVVNDRGILSGLVTSQSVVETLQAIASHLDDKKK
jgi:CBS domain-containing protein